MNDDELGESRDVILPWWQWFVPKHKCHLYSLRLLLENLQNHLAL
jgi:hypothetical protein